MLPNVPRFFGLTLLAVALLAPVADAQQRVCPNGQCPLVGQPGLQPAYLTPVDANRSIARIPCNEVLLTLTPLADAEGIDLTSAPIAEASNTGDRFERVIRATCKVTVSGVCGSGTVVGRDADGNAIVLTNAHVAGTQKGRLVQLQRWNADGSSERGQGAIIAAGYGRGLSVDFALLKCNSAFAADVQPIPLADRYPDAKAGVSTYGCPRCEWPSLQVLKLTRATGQVLHWQPEAIGGRSGSSVVDYTDAGPRVVGLLTWGGGGEGLGQSTPFLLDAMRGRLPKAFEPLPAHAQEVSGPARPSRDVLDSVGCDAITAFYHAERSATIRVMPCSLDGQLLAFNQLSVADETSGTTDGGVIDSIIEHGPDKDPDEGGLFRDRDKDKPKPGILNPDRGPGPIGRLFEWFRRVSITVVIAVGAAAAGYLIGRFRVV